MNPLRLRPLEFRAPVRSARAAARHRRFRRRGNLFTCAGQIQLV